MDETQLLQQAKRALNAGDKATAQRFLIQVIKQTPRSETAWLWLSAIVGDPARERECLERVLKINPDNPVAKRHFADLILGKSATAPPSPKPQSALVQAQAPQSQPTPQLPISPPEPSPLVPCPYCAEPIRRAAFVCRFCGRELKAGRQPSQLTLQQRMEILDREISGYTGRGFRLQSRSDTSAQLVKAKSFNLFWALVFLFTGIGLILYVLYYWSKKDEILFIQVDPYGRIVDSSGNVIHPSQTTRTPKKATRKRGVLVVVVVVVLCVMFLCGLGALMNYPTTPRVPLKVPEPVTYHRTAFTAEVEVPDPGPGYYDYNEVTIVADSQGHGFDFVLLDDGSEVDGGNGARIEEWNFDRPMKSVTRRLPQWVKWISPVRLADTELAFTITFSYDR